jgi:hypothetical protein
MMLCLQLVIIRMMLNMSLLCSSSSSSSMGMREITPR